MIKSIETTFRGYRFRSRLEARWAVVLDTLDVDFVYEPEGFQLPGCWYLPDFWVEEWDAYIEIKPCRSSAAETKKCSDLAKHSGKRVMCIEGQPYPDEYQIVFHSPPISEFGALRETCVFSRCPNCEAILVTDRDSNIMFHEALDTQCYCGDFPTLDKWCPTIMRAFETARAMRF